MLFCGMTCINSWSPAVVNVVVVCLEVGWSRQRSSISLFIMYSVCMKDSFERPQKSKASMSAQPSHLSSEQLTFIRTHGAGTDPQFLKQASCI